MHKIDNPKEATETITATLMFHPGAPLPVPELAFAVLICVVLVPNPPTVAVPWSPPYRVVTLGIPPKYVLALTDVKPVVRAVGELAPDIIPV